VEPQERYQMIKRIVETRRFNEDIYLNTIGMTVDDQKMLTVEGRIIPPPEVKYLGGHDGRTEIVERINIGKWNLRNRLQKTRPIESWACILISAYRPDQYQLNIAQRFVENFPRVTIETDPLSSMISV
jgi:hypothetical protein